MPIACLGESQRPLGRIAGVVDADPRSDGDLGRSHPFSPGDDQRAVFQRLPIEIPVDCECLAQLPRATGDVARARRPRQSPVASHLLVTGNRLGGANQNRFAIRSAARYGIQAMVQTVDQVDISHSTLAEERSIALVTTPLPSMTGPIRGTEIGLGLDDPRYQRIAVEPADQIASKELRRHGCSRTAVELQRQGTIATHPRRPLKARPAHNVSEDSPGTSDTCNASIINRMSLNLPKLFESVPEVLEPGFDPERPWDLLGDALEGILASLPSSAIEIELSPDAYLSGDRIVIGAGTRIYPGAVIEGPVWIGRDVQIRPGAYLRPGNWIGDGAIVGTHTEVKRSIFLPGAKAPHKNYVGDSILGCGVNLGAGTVLANFRHDGSEVRIPFAAERVATGRRKLGAVLGDRVLTGCGAVLHPGVVMGRGSQIYPGVQLRPGIYPTDSIVKLRQQIEIVTRIDGS